MIRSVTLPNLLAALPFKAGTVLAMEVCADGSVVLTDASGAPIHAADAIEQAIQAAYKSGIKICASEVLELQAARSDGGRTIRPFAMTAYTGASMRVPGFGNEPLIVDLAGMRVPATALPILRNHDDERIVAHTDKVDLTERRLRVAGLMSGVGPAALEVLQLADNGFPWQASIGADVNRSERVATGDSVRVNGRNWEGPLIVIRKSTLREISFVPMGADPNTSATVAGGEP
jgi:hypothetical protein